MFGQPQMAPMEADALTVNALDRLLTELAPLWMLAVNMARGSLFWSKPLIHLLVIYRIALRQMKIFLFMNSWLTL